MLLMSLRDITSFKVKGYVTNMCYMLLTILFLNISAKTKNNSKRVVSGVTCLRTVGLELH